MERPPPPDRWDYVAAGAVLALLAVGYLLFPNPIVQYGAWLTIFSVWMAWFVFYLTKWLYDVDI